MKKTLFRSTFAAAILLAGLLAGCDGDIIVDPDDEGPVPFETVYRSLNSGVSNSRGQVIRSFAEWDRVWDEIGDSGPAPAVNFGRDMVVLVAAGTQPNGCYSIDIRFIEVDRGFLEVEADLNVPAADCLCSPVVVRPVHAVRTPRIFNPSDFNIDRVIRSCGP